MSSEYVDDELAAFLSAGELRLQQCADCSRFVYYPRVVCPHCGGTSLAWAPHSGRGEVHSTTTIRRRPDRGGDYDLSLIDLEGGVRLMSRVVGIEPDAVRIGQPVKAEIINADDGPLLVFRPIEGEQA